MKKNQMCIFSELSENLRYFLTSDFSNMHVLYCHLDRPTISSGQLWLMISRFLSYLDIYSCSNFYHSNYMQLVLVKISLFLNRYTILFRNFLCYNAKFALHIKPWIHLPTWHWNALFLIFSPKFYLVFR